MGNNHEKNFSKTQRKILVLGVEKSGKTCLVQCIDGKELNEQNYTETKDLDIIDVKKQKISLQFYDFAGCERKRIFWRHHYIGAQGIIFVIDGSTMDKFQESFDALNQVMKEITLANVPICIFINKTDIAQQNDIKNKIDALIKEFQVPGPTFRKVFTVSGSNKNKEGHQQMIEQLISQMVAI